VRSPTHRGQPAISTRADLVVRVARALGDGFAQLVRRLVAPLVRTLGLHVGAHTRAAIEPAAIEPAAIEPAAIAVPGEAAVPPPPPPPPPSRAASLSARLPPEVECIEVPRDFGDPLYAAVFQRLQLGPRSKVLDLRAAHKLKLDLFGRLASAWRAPPGTVPKLAVVLGYESWAVLHPVAARWLRPLVDQGVRVELFYPQQVDRLAIWFACERVYHNVPAIVAWLRTEWRGAATVPLLATASAKAPADKAIAVWPAVLRATAKLVETHAAVEQVPELLLELSALARSFGAAESSDEAIRHVHAALHWIGDAPSAAKCRALRALALLRAARGEADDALQSLDTAVTIATVIGDRVEGASALGEIGLHAMRARQVARAERRFRRAVALLTDEDPPYLRAMLHHQLARALHEQGKDGDEAAQHASAALALRWDPGSRLASDDRALLAAIEAGRPASDPPHNPIRSRDTGQEAHHDKRV